MKIIDRQAIASWEEFHKSLISAATVNDFESVAEGLKRIEHLEAHPEEWFVYYFPKYATSKPAPFHKAATKRFLNNRRWYETRSWSRELAKSTRTMMEVLYLTLTGKAFNVLMISNSSDNAERLLKPYKLNLEDNSRIIKDYGLQQGFGSWEGGEFVTKKGVAFRALGAGQSPRGTRNEQYRADIILFDDIDTDEECRNPDRIDTKWKWIEKATLPTLSISGNYRILFCGNIIAKDCTILRSMEHANYVDIVNIRDKDGNSSWPEKNSEADIDQFLSMFSFSAQQGEFYNNPITEGTTFKEIVWDKVPPLSAFKFLVAYGDPASSNKDKGKNCYKALPLIGALGGKYYIITCYLQQITNAGFVEWYYFIDDYVKGKTQVYPYIENNSLQDPFFEQVFVPLFYEMGKKKGREIFVHPDERKKPDKFSRIEGNLEPLNRQMRLIFNEAERNNPHMVRLADQFKAIEPKLNSPCDGPDAVEGGIWINNSKINSAQSMKVGEKPKNSKRY